VITPIEPRGGREMGDDERTFNNNARPKHVPLGQMNKMKTIPIPKDWETQLHSEYSPVLAWAINENCDDDEDFDVRQNLKDNPIQIEFQSGWNIVNPIMLAAEFNNISKLEYMISLIEPNEYEYGRVLNMKNSLGNTALILAAIEGHLDIVKLLAESGADISIQNVYGHTAAILAIEHGKFDTACWLLDRDPDGLAICNTYGKFPLYVAAEFANASDGRILEWILTDFRERTDTNKKIVDSIINKPARNGKTALFFACRKGKFSARIVELMLNCGADATFIAMAGSRKADTCLMWAATDGNVEVAKVLLGWKFKRQRPDLFFISEDENRSTVLSNAAKTGKSEFVDYFVKYAATLYGHYDRRLRNYKHASMKVAWKEGHVKVATDLMEETDFSRPLKFVFDDAEIHALQRTYVRPEHATALIRLAEYAADYDFHFELFLLLIPCYQSPSSVLNKQLPAFYDKLRTRTEKKDVDLAYKLVRLMAYINIAASIHQMQKLDLQQRTEAIKDMLRECVASDSMDDTSTVQKMLCCAVKWNPDIRFEVATVERAQAFDVGPLATSLEHSVSALFCTGHVATFVDSIFWGFLRMPRGQGHLLHRSHIKNYMQKLLDSLDKEMGHLKVLKSRFIYFRFSPAMMFFGEALSRLWLFVLVSIISFRLRENMYVYIENKGPGTVAERMLLVLLYSSLLYEYGQLCHNTNSFIPSPKKAKLYFQVGWNHVHLIGLVAVAMWALFSFTPFEFSAENDHESVRTRAYISFGTVATSTILFATCFLRYLSIYEPVGKLVIMIIAMLKELAAFGLVFIVSCIGYCITLYCISEAQGFRSFSGAIQTLFAASLGKILFVKYLLYKFSDCYCTPFAGNYDSEYHALAATSPFVTLTLVIVVVFVIVSNVVLLNLIIARMSAVHERINLHSFQEWQLLRAVRTKRFLLLEESHPFCMLPPPINLFPSAFYLVHKFHLGRVHQNLADRMASISGRRRPPSGYVTWIQKVCGMLCGCMKFNNKSVVVPVIDASPGKPALNSASLHLPELLGGAQHNDIEDDDDSGIDGPEVWGSIPNITDSFHDAGSQELETMSRTVSICGTAADVFAGLLMSFIAPLYRNDFYAQECLQTFIRCYRCYQKFHFYACCVCCGVCPFRDISALGSFAYIYHGEGCRG
jgi:ankyrin repeat protein